MGQRKRRKFSSELKAEAVKLVVVQRRTVNSVAKSLDIHNTVLSNWVRLASVDGGKGATWRWPITPSLCCVA